MEIGIGLMKQECHFGILQKNITHKIIKDNLIYDANNAANISPRCAAVAIAIAHFALYSPPTLPASASIPVFRRRDFTLSLPKL